MCRSGLVTPFSVAVQPYALRAWGQPVAGGLSFNDLAVNVSRSTIAAQSRGSVKVLVQPPLRRDVAT